MAKLIDSVENGIGDVSDLMTNRGVSDLSWFDVDIEEYKKFQALPKQNLDTIPELSASLQAEKDERVPSIIPIKPFAIVNTNPLESPAATLRQAGSIRNRVAQYVMAGIPSRVAAERLSLEFSSEQIRAASSEVLPVLEERGLLGNVYVDSEHLPRCAQDSEDRAFVKKHASRSLYVKSKPSCSGCVHNRSGICASLNKRIVDTVPYDSKTLAHYAAQLTHEGRAPSLEGDRRTQLKVAFLQTPLQFRAESAKVIASQPKQVKVQVSESDISSFVERTHLKQGASDPLPGASYLNAARMMMLGRLDGTVAAQSPDPEVRMLASEYGIIGHTWLDADALGGPRQAAHYITKTGATPDYVLFRAPTLEDTNSGAVAELASVANVVAKRPPVDRNTFLLALQRGVIEGRISREQAVRASNHTGTHDWGRLTAQANLYTPPPVESGPEITPLATTKVHYGDPGRSLAAAPMDPEEVRSSISQMMNTGLHGSRLRAAIASRYTKADLVQVPEIGAMLAPLDGVQGDYFMDPTAYSDYGHGCKRGSEQFRKRGARYLLAGNKCTGCTLQTAPGWCSRYAKDIIRSVPQAVMTAGEERRRLPMVKDNSPVRDPVAKFGLVADDMSFDIPKAAAKRPEVVVPGPKVED